MKRFNLIALVLFLMTSSMFAQTQLSDGNNAMKAKNYPEAIKQYETYFAADKTKMKSDTKTLYNLSLAYLKNKNYDKAITNFDACIANNYKPDFSTYYKGLAQKEKGDQTAFVSTMTKGMDTYPATKKNFQRSLSNYYNTEAATSFNAGNKISNTASQNPKTYVSTMEKAMKKYDVAEAGFKRTLSIDPSNPVATSAMKTIDNNRKLFEEYKANLNK